MGFEPKPKDCPVLGQLGFVIVSNDICIPHDYANVVCLGMRHDRLPVPDRFKIAGPEVIVLTRMESPASWHPETPYRTRHGFLVYELDDTELHWVAARDEDEAFKLFMSIDGYTEEAYLDDYGEMPEIKVLSHFDLLEKTVRYDDVPDSGKVPMKDVADKMTSPGMVASTVW